MNATRTIAASIALAAAMGAALTANAGTVHDSVSKSDPRYMTTGCRFAGAFPSGAGSIGIWIKNVTDYATTASVFGSCHVNTTTSNDQGLLLFINSSGNFGFRVAGSKDGAVARQGITAAGTSSLLNDGNWHFLFGTFDKTSGKMDFYIDGESAGSANIDIDGLASARCFAIAAVGKPTESTTAQKENYGAGFQGLYAEATLWNKALTAEEVAALHTRRAYPWEDGLIGYWPLSDERNLAQGAVKRADDSRPGALFYYPQTVDDAGFFDDPPNLFVASGDWVAANNYVQPADATFMSPDDPATNIADAVSAAIAGNAIFLMPGTHSITSRIDITTANLTITGRYLGNDVGEAVVDAQRHSGHFRSHTSYSGANGWVFDGLTLANGNPGSSGGSMLFNSKTGVIRNCIFRDNAATGNGGAIYSYTASGTVVSNCVFTGNSASLYGGAIYTEQSSVNASDRIILSCCVVTNNTASRGGGVFASRSIEIDGGLFGWNSATSDNRGGNLRVSANSRVKDTIFTGDCSATRGACMAVEGAGANVIVSSSTFSGMSPTATYGVIFEAVNTTNSFVNCIFTDMSYNAPLFYHEGSGIFALCRQCLFGENAGTGAVVRNGGGKTRFENCTILSSNFDLGSTASENVLVNCVASNADIASSGTVKNIITNSIVKSVSGEAPNSKVMTGDPKFVDAANGNYRLSATSPCREKGLVLDWMTAGATDLDGNPRLANLLGLVGTDARPDLGCYECQEKGLVPTVVSFR